jgi:TRAP-type mannitol/chloroaromatic compound transport system permease large subunit
MIQISPELTTVLMFAGIFFGILMGFPLAFSLSGVAMIIGFLFGGAGLFEMFYLRLFGVVTEYVFLAFPLFVFMGIMVERSGVTDRLFGALYLLLGGLRGGAGHCDDSSGYHHGRDGGHYRSLGGYAGAHRPARHGQAEL